jgi:hypothetical protein
VGGMESGQRWIEVLSLQQCRMTSAKLLWLQEVALKLRLDPLKLLLSSIASDGGGSSLCGGYLHALGLGACRTEFDEHVPLFIGLLLLNHSTRGVLTDSILGLIHNRVGWRESKRG